MSKYISDLHKQLTNYRERYGNHYAKRSWHTLCYLFRHWFGGRYKFERRGNLVNLGFLVNGGIGDIVMYGAYLDKFIQKLDCKCKIYIFIYQSQDDIAGLFSEYKNNIEVLATDKLNQTPLDILFYFGVQFPEIYFYRKDYVLQKSKFLPVYLDALTDFFTKYAKLFESEHVFDQQVLLDIKGFNRISGMDPVQMLDLGPNDIMKTSLPENHRNILKKYGLSNNKFITFAYNLDILNKSKTSVRLWPSEHMQKLIKMIKRQYPQYKIVQLGTKSLANFDDVDLDLVGKTSFAELLTLLNGAKIHIDAECGMVHLRHTLCGKTSVVLHGPTSVSTKGYPENINIRSNVCNCPGCEWLAGKNWQNFCIKTESKIPACMLAITPKLVLNKVKGALK